MFCHRDLELTKDLMLDFSKLVSFKNQEVLPVVIQCVKTKSVLILAYTNFEAFSLTMETGRVVLWSTSRKELWFKGETSGNVLKLANSYVNCEQNSLLYEVHVMTGQVCHSKDASGEYRRTCFYRKIVTASESGYQLEFHD